MYSTTGAAAANTGAGLASTAGAGEKNLTTGAGVAKAAAEAACPKTMPSTALTHKLQVGSDTNPEGVAGHPGKCHMACQHESQQ